MASPLKETEGYFKFILTDMFYFDDNKDRRKHKRNDLCTNMKTS